jgi:predicted small metal-binding protein
MAKSIACDRVVPGCAFTTTAATEQELLDQVAEHARTAHGVSEVTPELLGKVKAAIETVTEKR